MWTTEEFLYETVHKVAKCIEYKYIFYVPIIIIIIYM